MTISRCYSNPATHEPQVCELCVLLQKFRGMGDPATSEIIIKGDRIHTVCDLYARASCFVLPPPPTPFFLAQKIVCCKE